MQDVSAQMETSRARSFESLERQLLQLLELLCPGCGETKRDPSGEFSAFLVIMQFYENKFQELTTSVYLEP